MRFSAFFIGVCAFIITGCVNTLSDVSVESESANWNTYVNDDFYYTIKYRSDFTLDDHGLKPADDFVRGISVAFEKFTPYSGRGEGLLSGDLQVLVGINKKPQCIPLSKCGSVIKINRYKAAQSTSENGMTGKSVSYTFEHNDLEYVVSFTPSDSEYAEIIEPMIQSFTFTL